MSTTKHFETSETGSDKLSGKFVNNSVSFQPKKVKNVSYDAFGTKEGKVHMQRQDYSKLQTRKMKGLKRQLNTKGKPQDKIKRKKTG